MGRRLQSSCDTAPSRLTARKGEETMSRRREGLYRQRGSPYWFADYVDGGSTRRRRSTRCTNRKDAQRVRAQWVTDAGNGAPTFPKDTTYRQLIADLKADFEQKGNRSWKRVEGALKHLDAFFGASKAIEINTLRIRAYAQLRLAEQASPATRQYELSVLRRALRVGHQNDKVAHLPAFPTIRVNNAREEFIDDAEVAALMIELPQHHRGWVRFKCETGWRTREVLDLKWDNVDWPAGTVWLRRGESKTGEPREFPFHNYPDVESVLTEQRAYTDQWERELGREVPWVFHCRGARIKDFYGAWRSACRRAGVVGADAKPKRPHDFRRSAARRCEQSGIPRSTSMKLLGHKTDSVFRRYAVVANKDLETATAKLAASRHSLGIVEQETAESGSER